MTAGAGTVGFGCTGDGMIDGKLKAESLADLLSAIFFAAVAVTAAGTGCRGSALRKETSGKGSCIGLGLEAGTGVVAGFATGRR
jgi:hypothetical protein